MSRGVGDDDLVRLAPIRSLLVTLPLVSAIAACAMPGRTFEEGVEHLPGSASYVVAVEPVAATDAKIELLMDETVTRMFPAEHGEARYLTGIGLPSTLTARVAGRLCGGAIVIGENLEADATLSVRADGCDLRLDLLHRTGTIDHKLEDSVP
jgi:hypothetical protein